MFFDVSKVGGIVGCKLKEVNGPLPCRQRRASMAARAARGRPTWKGGTAGRAACRSTWVWGPKGVGRSLVSQMCKERAKCFNLEVKIENR